MDRPLTRDLTKISTVNLLKMRVYPWPDDPVEEQEQYDIREELSKREHIPKTKQGRRFSRRKITGKKKKLRYSRHEDLTK
jgi:hypothetical protein